MANAFQARAFEPASFEVAAQARARALRIALADLRSTAALADLRSTAALADLRSTAALAEVVQPDGTSGAVMVVSQRVPMLTTTGTPPSYAPPNVHCPWAAASGTTDSGAISLGYFEVLPEEPAHYVPGALRPLDANGYTSDTIRVTDDAGTFRDAFVWFGGAIVHDDQVLEVPIGTDGVAALYSGGELALTATGGTGPYVWDFALSRSGGSISEAGAYVAGPLVGIDRLRVTDSLGAIAYVQVEVIAGQIPVDMTADPVTEQTRFHHVGYQCTPYAKVWGQGGLAPYAIELLDNQTGAAIEPGKGMRAAVQLRDLSGNLVDLTGWTFSAKLYGQRGAVLASGLPVSATGSLLEVELPDPDSLTMPAVVLRITCETAGAILALGYPTTAVEVLLVAEET